MRYVCLLTNLKTEASTLWQTWPEGQSFPINATHKLLYMNMYTFPEVHATHKPKNMNTISRCTYFECGRSLITVVFVADVVFLVLRGVQLLNLFLYILVKCSLPELHVLPHRMLLNACVCKLDDPCTQFLLTKNSSIKHHSLFDMFKHSAFKNIIIKNFILSVRPSLRLIAYTNTSGIFVCLL